MKKVIMLLLVLTGYACTSPDTGKDGYEPIDLDSAFSQAGGISVSDMGDRVSYVPLETTDESLIGKRAYVRMLKDKLLVGSFGQPVKMFDRKTGKFIRAVGNIGQGADEYSLQYDIPVFWTDDKKEMIYVQTEGRRILRFDVDGEPLEAIHLPDSFPLLQSVYPITANGKLYAYQRALFKRQNYKILQYDIPGEKIEGGILNEDDVLPTDFAQTPVIFPGLGNIPVSPCCLIFQMKDERMVFHHVKEPCLWSFDKNVYFKESFNDTIYQVSDNKLKPRLVFDLGDRHCAYEDRYKIEGSQNKIAIDYILEGKNALFFVFKTNYYHIQDVKTYWGVYNKKNKSVKVTDAGKIEDTENSLFIGKLHTATSDGQLVGLVDAATFIEYAADKEGFHISEEDNPIVTIIE